MRRSVIFQPLAVILAILLSPALSWLNAGAHRGGSKPLQAGAQVVAGGCESTTNSIIRNYCVNGTNYAVVLGWLEDKAVKNYLAAHNIPSSESSVIYNLGRTDLRNAVRAHMYSIMVDIIGKNPADRTQIERTLYTWLQTLVQNFEIKMYQEALDHYNHFRRDPCTFQMDKDLASTYGIEWSSAAFCFPGAQSNLFEPMVPNSAYFEAYGAKRSYMAKAFTTDPGYDPTYASLFADTSVSIGHIAGVSLAAGGTAAAIAGLSVTYAYVAAVAAQAAAAGTLTAGTAGLAKMGFLVGAQAVSVGITAAAATGAATIVLIAVAAGIVGSYQIFNDQQQQQQLIAFTNRAAGVRATPPDLPTILDGDSELGTFKIQNAIFSQTAPDMPSSATLPGRQTGDLGFLVQSARLRSNQEGSKDSFRYLDWANNIWTVRTTGRWLVQSCEVGPRSTAPCPADPVCLALRQNNSSAPCPLYPRINATLRYKSWDRSTVDDRVFTPHDQTAARSNDTFFNSASRVTRDLRTCPVEPRFGVSPESIGPNPRTQKCISFVSKVLKMYDADGVPIIVQLTKWGAPSFVDPDPLSFGIGVPATKVITTTFDPPARICWESGFIPSIQPPSVGYCSDNGTYPLVYNGALNAPPASFTLRLRATNSFGSTTRDFPVNLSNTLAIVSPLSCPNPNYCVLPLEYGKPMSYTVVATGNPTPRLSLDPSGSDFTGLTFVDNRDGTGTLSGTFTGSPFANGTCGDLLNPPCGGFVATNSQGTTIKRFRLTPLPAPQALFNGDPSNIYVMQAGVPNSFRLTTYNNTTPVTWTLGNNPSWLTLRDNGDSSATLSGTPPLGFTGFQGFSVRMSAAGALPSFRSPSILVVGEPAFSTPNQATFVAGTGGSFTPTATSGSITATGALPNGLTFTPGNPAWIAGSPAIGTGGQYPIGLTATGSSGTGTQAMTVTVNEAPSFRSPNLAILFAGKPAAIDVTTFGFPSLSTVPVTPGSSFVTDPSLGMQFNVSGLPSSLSAGNLNPAGFATGTLRIFGTPTNADIGTRRVTIRAFNSIGSAATQTLTLQVLPNNPIAPVGLVSSWVLSRDSANNVLATVVIANNGSQDAQNVALTSARIGPWAAAVFPAQLASIPAGGSGTFFLLFRAAAMGAAGSSGVISLSGSYTGGTFANSGRIVLP